MQVALTVRQREWLVAIDAQQRSGLSQRAWCRERGIAAGTFAWWKHRLSALGGEPGIGFVDIVVAEPPSTRATVDIILRESGHHVVVARDFDEHTLRRVVAVLERRS